MKFAVATALAVSLPLASTVIAGTAVHQLVTNAMQECALGRQSQDRASRIDHFLRGQAYGEQAMEANETSAQAHFALFCNLGEQMRIDGEQSIGSVFGFRRMMKELNRTLELAPDHLDALSAKGTFLIRLPSLLGGDKEKGEQILRHVIDREPAAVNARLSLAKSYCAGGRHEEAITIATKALELAQGLQRADFIPEARQVLTHLLAQAPKSR
ncbi:MAG: hypothetical protein AMXMBFR67_33190 [Nitrospira sp.]